MSGAVEIRVVLPYHLRTLAKVQGEVRLRLNSPATAGPVPPGPAAAAPPTQRAVLDALEAAYPVLRGTIRDHVTHRRRAFIRFFACEQDLSLDDPDAPLPPAVAAGDEPFMVIGALAGG